MLAGPTRVASPGRRRARRDRANTNPAPSSFGDALERSASPADRQPIPQQNQQDDDLLGFGFLAAASPPAQPYSAPNPAVAGGPTQQPQQPRASDDMFDFFGDMKTQSAPTSPPQQEAGTTLPTIGSFNEGSKKKKKKKRKGRDRAATLPARGQEEDMAPPSHPAPPPPINELDAAAAEAPPADAGSKTSRRMKQIDVLPLLHQGIRMYKFKFAGSGRAKQRTFFLTDDNKFLCWEAKGPEALAKAADDRQVYLGQIRAINRNEPERVQQLSDIRHKQFTLSIVYVHKGGEKVLNIMAFNAFHYQLIGEGLEKLVAATNESGRDLADIFELYLNFDKEILPDHLKPQRFKWEALREDDIALRERSQTVPAQSNEPVDMFVPTETRERVSSF